MPANPEHEKIMPPPSLSYDDVFGPAQIPVAGFAPGSKTPPVALALLRLKTLGFHNAGAG